MKAAPRRPLPSSVKVLLGVVALALVACCLIYVLGVLATSKWERYVDELRDDGLPLTYAEVLEQHGQPRAATAAGGITELTERLEVVYGSQSDDVCFLDYEVPARDFIIGIPQYSIEPTREFLAEHRDVLGELIALADLPPGRIPAPRTLDPASPVFVPELFASRTAAKLLSAQTVIFLRDGDFAAALWCVRSQRRIVEAYDQYPLLMGRLVQISIDTLWVRALEGLLHSTTLDDQDVEALARGLDSRSLAATLKWALLGERAFWGEMCDQIVAGEFDPSWLLAGDPFAESDEVPHHWLPVWLVRQNQLRGTELLTRLIRAADDREGLMAADREVDREIASAGWMYLLVRKCLPSVSRACTLDAMNVAMLGSARAALAAERFRMANDRLPTSLDELVPAYLEAIPVDPFDGGAMRLATTDRGIVIYSIGENLYDDGGEVGRSPDAYIPQDVGFRLVRPEQRGVVVLDVPLPDEED